ncbi:MAG: hypothetical protein IPK99_17650 [Flavobacteriales bacterium]|nr:hypothetical protein [Flavobacteriales bacterium]
MKVEIGGTGMGVLRILEQGCTYAEWTILVPSVVPHATAVDLVPQPFTHQVTVTTDDPEAMELVLFDLAARPGCAAASVGPRPSPPHTLRTGCTFSS